MGLASKVAPHLPFLRRYARSLTGDQPSADAYVAAYLETLIAAPDGLDKAGDIRTALYRGFTRLWDSTARGGAPSDAAPHWEAAAQRHLSAVDPKARQAFLLMAVEGFAKPQIADILGLSPGAAEALIEVAQRSIAAGVATDVLIIEDEPIIAMDLEAVMESMGHTVTGNARTETEALRLAQAKRPGLVLADIKLADGSSGIDAVNKLLQIFQVPVVFITAYPERLLTGERPEPAFLITKPFMPMMVKAVVSQALFFDTKPRAAA